MTRTLTTCLFVAPCFLLCLAPAVFGAERVVTLEPESTAVTFFLEATGHDVEGRLQLSGAELRLDPATGAAGGEVKIALQGAETGNEKRDKTMHQKVFESDKYPWIVFTPDRFTGTLPESGTGEVELHGTVSMHGADHPLTMKARVDVADGKVTGETTFTVPYVAWGMEDPSILFLRVAKEVQVTVKASGTIHANGAGAAASMR